MDHISLNLWTWKNHTNHTQEQTLGFGKYWYDFSFPMIRFHFERKLFLVVMVVMLILMNRFEFWLTKESIGAAQSIGPVDLAIASPNMSHWSSHRRYSVKKVLLNTLYLSVFSPNAGKYGPERLQIRALGLQLYLKGTSALVFSCEICEFFKNTYFEEHLWTTAFGIRFLKPLKQELGAMITALRAARDLSKYLRTLALMESSLKITYHGFYLNLKVAKL